MTEVFKTNDTALLYYQEAIIEKKSVSFDITSKEFGDKWLDISVYPTGTGVTCYFRDITSRKIAEKALRQSEEKFSKVFHGGPIMMALATIKEGEILDANEALCSGTGYTREELIGCTSNELNIYVDMNRRQELEKMLTELGRLQNENVAFRTKSGGFLCFGNVFNVYTPMGKRFRTRWYSYWCRKGNMVVKHCKVDIEE